MILMTVGCGLAVLISSVVLFSREVNESLDEKIIMSKMVVDQEIDKMKAEAHVAAFAMANNQSLIDALKSGDRYNVLGTAQDLLSLTYLDYCTIRGSDGRVIALTHDPDFYGDEIAPMPHIESAYAGRTEAHIVQGVTIPLAVSAGAPVYDIDGTFLGVVALGYRFDSQELVYALKGLTGCEITFFSDDELISSTVVDEDGSYAIGTHVDPEISEHVKNGEPFIGRVQLFGRDVLAAYSPLVGIDGEVLGMVFTGYFTEGEINKVWFFALSGVLITLGVFILCIILAKIISTSIERNMAKLAVYRDRERETASHYEYSKKLADALSTITKSPDIPAGDIKAAAEIIASKACEVLNIHRISIWSLSESEDALVNITCYERSTGEHSVHDDFDLLERASYADLLRSERLIVTSNIHESADVDDGYNPDICAMLEAPIRLDGNLIGLVCADLDRCEEFPEEREWLVEEQNFVSSLADLMALAISGYERRMARDAAETANQAKSTFLANMSHEIRTPMNSILGITDILLQKNILPQDIEDGLNRIYTSSDMLLGIINDILDFSKIEAGKLDILPTKYEMASFINDSVQLNMTRTYGKPIEFEVQVDEMVPARLIGDELRIKQIMNNLLSNAFKFTEAGKVTLSVISEILPGTDDITLILIVRDTGRGMTPEQLSSMFDEYSRFNETQGVAIEGTGLGLAITQRLVSLMNGGILVESEPDVGSVFTVRLPQKRIDDELLGKEVSEHLQHFRMNYVKRNRRGQIAQEPMPYGKVLIVDDVEANRYVAVGLMKPYKLHIETASSGFEAIDKINSGIVYDIVFLDHMMPELDGIETAKRLRELGYKEPIIALTANAVAGQSEMFLQNGFDFFISKPIDLRQLNVVLRKYIRDKQPPEVIEEVLKSYGDAADSEAVSGDDSEHSRTQAPVSYTSANMADDNESGGSDLLEMIVEGLDIVKGVNRYSGDGEQYLRVMRSYMNSVRTVLDAIEVFDEDRLLDYEIKVHGIKGASLDIFAKDVGKEADALERAAQAGDVDFIRTHHTRFVLAARKLVSDLEELFLAINSKKSKSVKDKPENDALYKLLKACSEYNLNEVDSTMAEIDQFKYDSDDGLADWLRVNVDLMNYSEIVEKLSEFID